jgi:hypothetical protein
MRQSLMLLAPFLSIAIGIGVVLVRRYTAPKDE